MSTQPTPQQLDQLTSALLQAFDHDELTRLVRSQFDQPLEWITPVVGKRDLTTIASDLVAYFASEEGGLKKLLAAAIRENPLSPDLSPIAVEWSAIEFESLPLPLDHPHMIETTVVHGDQIGGDKIGGDVVHGDKIVYENASPLNLSELEQAYLKGLYADCNELLLANDGPVDHSTKRQPRMQHVYVDLDTDTGLTTLEAIRKNNQLVILGDPGGGKSTLTRRLAGVLASDCRNDLDKTEAQWLAKLDAVFRRRLLPVRVVMSRWAVNLRGNATGCAADLISECLRIQQQTANISGQSQEEHFTARLTGDEPTALILLDGLDEVSDPERRAKLLVAVKDFCQSFKNVPLIVTCRIRPYESWTQNGEALPLPVFTLAGLSRDAVTSFIDRWHEELLWAGRYQPTASETAKSRLLDAINDKHRQELQEMAKTPLLLTMMARVNYKKGLPNNRAMLYEEYVDQLLWEWERTKLDDQGEPTSLESLLNKAGVPRGSLEKALDRLAYEFHDPVNHNDTVDIPKHAVRDEIEFIHSTEDEKAAERAAWAVNVLRIMDDRSGLLYSKDHETYHFSHRTFQEYLAARQIATGEFITKFEERIDIEAWREALFLALGYQIAVRSEYDNALAVFDELIPTDPNTPEDWRRVILLGDAYIHLFGPRLASQTERKNLAERVLKTIPSLLTQTMQNPTVPPKQRLEAGKLLADLEIDPPDLDVFIAISDHSFRIAKYPVTNRQFGHFIDAGGYQNDKYWTDERGRADRDENNWTEPHYWNNKRFNWSNQPIVGVAWDEANAYCAWLTNSLKQSGEIGENEVVRLPTQDEWMAAAGADLYPWEANDFDGANANTKESNLGQTTPVHMYKTGKTKDGVWDLSGNVWEWSQDLIWNGWPCLRGGSWRDNASRAKSSASDWHDPDARSYDLGFRVLVVPVSLENS